MDAERQPLMGDVRRRRARPLTFEEVLAVRQNSIWRRCRLILILIFWATMAMFLSMVTCLLLQSQCRPELSSVRGIPPVHRTLAPLIATTAAEAIWRWCRLILILIFWATMAMFLSMVTCLLLQSQCRPELSSVRGIPPVHLTLAPLIATTAEAIWRWCSLILIFWATMAMFLSMVTCLLLQSQCRPELSSVRGIPPVHLTLAPLIATTAEAYILS